MKYQTIRRPTLRDRLALAANRKRFEQKGGQPRETSNPLVFKG